VQEPDQLLASDFKGIDGVGADRQNIGDMSDIPFGRDGKIKAWVARVGGFLGMGAGALGYVGSDDGHIVQDAPEDKCVRHAGLSFRQSKTDIKSRSISIAPSTPVMNSAFRTFHGGTSRR